MIEIPETIGGLYRMSSKIKKKIGRPKKYGEDTEFRCFRIPISLDKKVIKMTEDKKISMNEVIVHALDKFFYGGE
tara:strand:+ start:158 stop:382 length:225 start_codon:yes stop_codon:yes gene_type:complete